MKQLKYIIIKEEKNKIYPLIPLYLGSKCFITHLNLVRAYCYIFKKSGDMVRNCVAANTG